MVKHLSLLTNQAEVYIVLQWVEGGDVDEEAETASADLGRRSSGRGQGLDAPGYPSDNSGRSQRRRG
jgi:hypothetical protein